MQTENLSKNNQKQFYVPLNTNQIKLYTYPDLLKENLLLRKFLKSESTAYFLDETFYHTHILLFSIKYFSQPQNIARITSSIIHMT